MLRFALRHLQSDLPRAALTAFAVGSVIAVILILKGFEQGQYHQLERLVHNRRADLIAAQAGIANFTAVRSSIPQMARGEIESVEGVVSAHPITAIPVIYEENGRRTPVSIIVYDTKGGPAMIVRGNDIVDSRDIVVDVSLAKKYGLSPGDTFIVSDFEFNVSGITEESAFMMPFAFISYDGMIDLYLESEIAPDLSTFPLLSYMLIELDPAADRDEVARRIEAGVPSVDVFRSEELAMRDVTLGKAFFGPIMGLLVGVANVIGLLVIALVMYADVRGRLRTFAVLKALGFSQVRLSGAVLLQAFILLIAALPVAVLLGLGLAELIQSAAPLYLIRIFEPFVFGLTIAASLMFAIMGAFVPLHLVRRSDPMVAFEGN